MRNRLIKESVDFNDKISQSLDNYVITPNGLVSTLSSLESARNAAFTENSKIFDDIESVLSELFNDCFISGTDEE